MKYHDILVTIEVAPKAALLMMKSQIEMELRNTKMNQKNIRWVYLIHINERLSRM